MMIENSTVSLVAPDTVVLPSLHTCRGRRSGSVVVTLT